MLGTWEAHMRWHLTQQLSQILCLASMRGCLVALPCVAERSSRDAAPTTTLRQPAAPEASSAPTTGNGSRRIEAVLARRTSRLVVVLERSWTATTTAPSSGPARPWASSTLVVAPPRGRGRAGARPARRRRNARGNTPRATRTGAPTTSPSGRLAQGPAAAEGGRRPLGRRVDAEHAVHGRGAALFVRARLASTRR